MGVSVTIRKDPVREVFLDDGELGPIAKETGIWHPIGRNLCRMGPI